MRRGAFDPLGRIQQSAKVSRCKTVGVAGTYTHFKRVNGACTSVLEAYVKESLRSLRSLRSCDGSRALVLAERQRKERRCPLIRQPQTGVSMLLLCAPTLQHELRPVIVMQCDGRMLFPTLVKTRELQNAMTLLLLALVPLLLLALALLLLVAAGIRV